MPHPGPTTPAWVEAARQDTPGVNEVVHLNNAGAALPPTPVLDTMIGHLRQEARIGGYEAADQAAERIEAVYSSLAELISAESSQIAVVENATRGWDRAVYGYPFNSGDRILTSRAEYASNAIAFLQLTDRHGVTIVLIDDDEHGQISLAHLRRPRHAQQSLGPLLQHRRRDRSTRRRDNASRSIGDRHARLSASRSLTIEARTERKEQR